MGWHYRRPASFPAIFYSTLQAAVANAGEPQVLMAGTSETDLAHIAEQFRWFKWCTKHDPGTWAANVLENYDIRTQIKNDAVGPLLWLTAKPTKVSEFIRLNPDLADEIWSECQ